MNNFVRNIANLCGVILFNMFMASAVKLYFGIEGEPWWWVTAIFIYGFTSSFFWFRWLDKPDTKEPTIQESE